VDTTIVPLPGSDGKPAEYLAIRSDITARKAMEQQLADKEALTQLGELAAVVAHEVRNPLAGVKGSLQVMRSRIAVTEMDRRVIDTMIARLDTLNDKVDDLLKFARPRSPRLEPVDVSALLADAAASATAAGEAGPGIRLPHTTSRVVADGEMIRALFPQPAAERLRIRFIGADRSGRRRSGWHLPDRSRRPWNRVWRRGP
jgi:signal transduction histidine kinase